MKDNEYKCSMCFGIFEKGWTDMEADIEAVELWEGSQLKSTMIVCDDCFKKYMAEYN